jgi:C4-type Zn-finger protein
MPLRNELMVLTNAERQQRHRERLNVLAARAKISEAMADLLLRHRHHIREWRASIVRFRSGQMHLYENDVDISGAHVARLQSYIATSEGILTQYDPDGVTATDAPEDESVDELFDRLNNVLESTPVGQPVVMGSAVFEECMWRGTAVDIQPPGRNPVYRGLWPVVLQPELPEWEFRIDPAHQ